VSEENEINPIDCNEVDLAVVQAPGPSSVVDDDMPELNFSSTSRLVCVFENGSKQDIRLPLDIDLARDGLQVSKLFGKSRVLLFSEYIRQGLQADMIKYKTYLELKGFVPSTAILSNTEVANTEMKEVDKSGEGLS
jgi:hypothetical protein